MNGGAWRRRAVSSGPRKSMCTGRAAAILNAAIFAGGATLARGALTVLAVPRPRLLAVADHRGPAGLAPWLARCTSWQCGFTHGHAGVACGGDGVGGGGGAAGPSAGPARRALEALGVHVRVGPGADDAVTVDSGAVAAVAAAAAAAADGASHGDSPAGGRTKQQLL